MKYFIGDLLSSCIVFEPVDRHGVWCLVMTLLPLAPTGHSQMCFCRMPPVVAGWGPRISLVGLTGKVFVTASPPGKARAREPGRWRCGPERALGRYKSTRRVAAADCVDGRMASGWRGPGKE